MAQYKHDRFFKFYVQALYKTKGETRKNIKVMNDEELEIDCMFLAQSDKLGWQQEDLGLFDRLMKKHPTITRWWRYAVVEDVGEQRFGTESLWGNRAVIAK